MIYTNEPELRDKVVYDWYNGYRSLHWKNTSQRSRQIVPIVYHD